MSLSVPVATSAPGVAFGGFAGGPRSLGGVPIAQSAYLRPPPQAGYPAPAPAMRRMASSPMPYSKNIAAPMPPMAPSMTYCAPSYAAEIGQCRTDVEDIHSAVKETDAKVAGVQDALKGLTDKISNLAEDLIQLKDEMRRKLDNKLDNDALTDAIKKANEEVDMKIDEVKDMVASMPTATYVTEYAPATAYATAPATTYVSSASATTYVSAAPTTYSGSTTFAAATGYPTTTYGPRPGTRVVYN